MKSRLLASLAVGAAVVLGATGCNMLAPQATTIDYSASDGINVPNLGDVKIRNVMIVANEDGTEGNLIGAFVNGSDESARVSIGVAGDTEELTVPARETVSLGVTDDPLSFSDLGARPGANIPVTFATADGTGEEIMIPIIDGALPQYAEFVPGD